MNSQRHHVSLAQREAGQETTWPTPGCGGSAHEMDTRIIRRWNLDPVDQISISNYAVNRNNYIALSDPLGDDPKKGDENDPVELKEVEVKPTKSTGQQMNSRMVESMYNAYAANKSFGDTRPRTGDFSKYVSYNLQRDNAIKESVFRVEDGSSFPSGIQENVERILQNSILNHHGNNYGSNVTYYDKGGYGEVISKPGGGGNGASRIAQYVGPYIMEYYAPGIGAGLGNFSSVYEQIGNFGNAADNVISLYSDIKDYASRDKPMLRKASVEYNKDGGITIDTRPGTDTNGNAKALQEYKDSIINGSTK